MGLAGRVVNLQQSTISPTVFFFYLHAGLPDEPTPEGWDDIPGARGCTPQSCGFRDLQLEFAGLGFQIFGVSTQNSEYQSEFVARMHIPFEILSDEQGELTQALTLPTFEFLGKTLIKRMAWIVSHGSIRKVFYPVFPPNENAQTVLNWIQNGRFKNHPKKC